MAIILLALLKLSSPSVIMSEHESEVPLLHCNVGESRTADGPAHHFAV